jgi:hypothetical protein
VLYAINVAWTVDEKKKFFKKERPCAKKLVGFKGNTFENTCQELFRSSF